MGEVYSGEVVPADQGPQEPQGDRGYNRNDRSEEGQQRWERQQQRGRRSFATDDQVAGVIADRVRGMKLRMVAEKWGVSIETVRIWCGDDKRRRLATNVDELRAEAAQQLDVVRREAWGMYEAGMVTSQPKVMDAALTRVESSTMAKAKLEGAIRPVRVDVEVHAVTEAERELQEMLTEAAAKAAAEERTIIDAANADPDL